MLSLAVRCAASRGSASALKARVEFDGRSSVSEGRGGAVSGPRRASRSVRVPPPRAGDRSRRLLMSARPESRDRPVKRAPRHSESRWSRGPSAKRDEMPFPGDSEAQIEKELDQFNERMLKEIGPEKWEAFLITAYREFKYTEVVFAYEAMCGREIRKTEMSDMYTASLEQLGSRDQSIVDCYESMKAQCVPMTPAAYARAMRAYTRLGRHKMALDVYEHVLSIGVQGTTELYYCLLSMYAKFFPEDLSLFEEAVKHIGSSMNRVLLERILLHYSNIQRQDMVLRTYKEFVEGGHVNPGRITYCIMAEMMFSQGRADKALEFVRRLDDLSLAPRSQTYNAIIKHLLSADDTARADKRFREFRQSTRYVPNLDLYKLFINHYLDRREFSKIPGVLSDLTADDLPLDREMLEMALLTWYYIGNANSFFDTFSAMLERQIMPSRHFYSKRLELVSRQTPTNPFLLMREYEYMIQVGITPTEQDIRIIMSSFYANNRPDLAYEFSVDEMPKWNLSLRPSDYTLLLRSWLSVGSASDFFDTWERYLASDLSLLEAEPFVLAIQACFRFGLPDRALELWTTLRQHLSQGQLKLDELQTPRLMECFSTLSGTNSLSPLQDLYEIQCKNNPQALTLDSFEILINAFSRDHPDRSLSYFRSMQEDHNIPASAAIYHSLLSALSSQTQNKRSNDLFAEVIALATRASFDLSIQPLQTSLVSVFLLCFIKHGNHALFSQALVWFRHVHQLPAPHLDFKQCTLLRKWIRTLSRENSVPAQFTSRNLTILSRFMQVEPPHTLL